MTHRSEQEPASEPADVMCTLCGATGVVETNVDLIAARASAAAWAAHFALQHPDQPRGVSRFLVMTEANEASA